MTTSKKPKPAPAAKPSDQDAASNQVGTDQHAGPTTSPAEPARDAGAATPSEPVSGGTNSTDTPPSEAASGTGNLAGPVGFPTEMLDRYPLLCAAHEKLKQELPAGFEGKLAVRITSKEDGFRRGGMEHTGTVDHIDPRFSLDQLEAILGEPLLVVEFVQVD